MNPKLIMLGERKQTKKKATFGMIPLYEIPENGARGGIKDGLQRGTRKALEVMQMYLP